MKKYLFKLSTIMLCLSLANCQKSDNQKQVVGTGNKVTFELSEDLGYTTEDNESNQGAQARSMNTPVNSIVKTELHHEPNENMDVVITKEEFGIPNDLKIKASTSNSGKSGDLKASVIPEYPDNYLPFSPQPVYQKLPKGVKFRVLIYSSAGEYIGEVDGTSGSATAPTFDNLKQNTVYNWYAYSYYSSDPLPAIPVAQRNNPVFNVENEDFIFASGSFNSGINAGGISSVDVKVTFKHAMTMIQLSVYTTGFSAKPNLNAFLATAGSAPYMSVPANILEKGVFNLKLGKFQSKSAITNDVRAVARLNYAYSATGEKNTSYRGFVYTVPADNNTDYIDNFKYTVSPWFILDRPTNPVVFTKTYSDSKVRKGMGMFTRISVVPLDLGIGPITSSASGNTNWARGDLYYDETFSSDFLDGYTRFQHRNHEPASIRYASSLNAKGVQNPDGATYGTAVNQFGATYYPYGYTYPIGAVRSSGAGTNTNIDPCTQLMPNSGEAINKWRLPTLLQAKALVDYINTYKGTGRISHTYSAANNSLIFVINIKDGAVSDWSERLSFEMKGYALTPNGVNSNVGATIAPGTEPTINSTQQKGFAYFWIGTTAQGLPGGNDHAFVQISLDATQSNGKTISARIYRKDIVSDQPSNAYYVSPISDVTKVAMPVRCVRVQGSY